MSIPVWIREGIRKREGIERLKGRLRLYNLHTVCEEARCPNIGKCFNDNTATFLILGDICTRNCTFCAVKKGFPEKVDENEPSNVADMVIEMGLDYVVITSVTRDDIEDGGAEHFRKTISKIREKGKDVKIEVLIPDFRGNKESLKKIFDAKPDVINHNLETVPRLYKDVRPMANYKISLDILKSSKENGFITKTGIMLGLGEKREDVFELIEHISKIGCDILTIGQYLRPSRFHIPVYEYVIPEEFEFYKEYALRKGIRYVVSAPLVRSSFMAKEAYFSLKGKND
uniref:Lipoyl synthase n=1 Tax=candidate division WOR-3 bacterium TaxID=2052148 RepID=A0A7C4U617_UNCW3